jgi:hypothetical protein
MPGFSIDKGGTGQQVVYADNVDFTGNGSNNVRATVTANGQLLIGSTASPHIQVGNITSPLGTLTVGYSSPNITVDLVGGFDDLHVAKWIVNPTPGAGGNQTTITAALLAASSGDTIFITPGTYTENLTLKAGVNLVAFDADAFTPNVTIIGKMTATFTGTCSLSGLRFQTNSDFILVISGSNVTKINMFDCYINATNNSAFSLTSSGGGVFTLEDCNGTLGTTGINYFTITNNTNITFLNCLMFNSAPSTTASTSSIGLIAFSNTEFLNQVTTTGTAGVGAVYSDFRNGGSSNQICFTVGGSGANSFRFTNMESGTQSCVSVSTSVTLESCTLNSTNTNCVTGAGGINYCGLNFTNTSSLMNTTTQVPIVASNDAVTVKTPGAYPYTTVPQDYLILVDTSSARSIVPLASPTTGQVHVIKDTVGSAAANNITVTPSGKNIDGSASFVMNVNYGSITIVYNGSSWSII